MLHKSLGHGQLVLDRINDDARYCSELFITLTHEVHLKGAVGAGELDVPCELLHT